MLTIDQHLQPLIQREAGDLETRFPKHRAQIQSLIADFGARFRENLTQFEEVFDLCRRVEVMLGEHEIPQELRDAIYTSRQKILADLILHGLTHGSLEGNMPARFTRQLPLPEPRGNGKKKTPQRTQAEIEQLIQNQNFDLIRLATWLGPDAAADVLCALGQVGEDDRARVISFISAYLGKSSHIQGIDVYGILTYPRAVLDVPTVRRVIERLLLQNCYSALLEEGIDEPGRSGQVRRRAAGIALKHMTGIARQAGVTDPSIHAELFVQISELIGRACSQQHPENLVRSLKERGEEQPFPSLRQLIAVQLLRERRKLYVGFEPGKGKTPIPFYLYEQEREKGKRQRMLYLGPLPVIQELPNRIRPGSAPQATRDCYYTDPEQAPSVGVVDRSLKTEELERLMKKEDIVFVPYSMLHAKRKKKNGGEEEHDELTEETLHLIDVLAEQRWDVLVIDEAHYIDGNKTWTRLVDRLMHGEDGRGTHLIRNGYRIALSGSPVMNTIADPVIIHDLFQTPQQRDQRYGVDLQETLGRDTVTERGLDPLRVRQAINETLLILDPPQEWLQNHVETFPYPLSTRELQFLRGICSNASLTAKQKIDACMQFILCPQLVSGDSTMEETLLGWTQLQLEHLLQEKNSVLLTENMRAQGVLRETNDEDADPSDMELHFYNRIGQECERLQEQLGTEIHYYVIHGKTKQDYRQQAYRDAAIAQRDGTHKVVIFAMTQCLNVGIRLHVDRVVTLEWPHNSPELHQLLMRALREGMEDVQMIACYAQGTVQQGVYEQSIDKYRDAMTCLYGRDVSDVMLRTHIQRRSDNPSPGTESDLDRYLKQLSTTERRYEVERWLHTRGLNDVRQFWERHRELFDELHAEADLNGTGDMHRFVASLLHGMLTRDRSQGTAVLDVNSNGLALERELRRLGTNGQALLMSTDIHSWMLERGRAALHRDPTTQGGHPFSLQTNPTDIFREFQAGQLTQSLDIAVLNQLEQCNHIQADQMLHERARALHAVVRSVRPEGRIIIPFSRTSCTSEEFDRFVSETLPLFGCIARDGWFGPVRSQENEGDSPFRGFCVVAEKVEDVDEAMLRSSLRSADLRLTHHGHWTTTAEGVRIANAMRRPRSPVPLRHAEFRFGNRTLTASQKENERTAQVKHLRALEEAVGTVRSLARNKTEWNALPAAQRKSLERRGILYSAELSNTVGRPMFSLREYPGHFFFPYDLQWNAQETEE